MLVSCHFSKVVSGKSAVFSNWLFAGYLLKVVGFNMFPDFFPLCGVRWNTLDSFQRLCTPAMLMNCSTHFSYDELRFQVGWRLLVHSLSQS